MKDDIFEFVYGLLHSPDYRSEFASDLTKMLPRIPPLKLASDFQLFVEAGRELMALHLNYESVEPYPLEEERAAGASLLVDRMRFAGKAGAWDC
jgi:predicted helicase